MKAIRLAVVWLAIAVGMLPAQEALAQKKYGPGVTDTEIKIGNTTAYSGPNSQFGVMARVMAAYFAQINDHGGINGRKIKFISYDDAFNPSKTVEQARKLVESDEVLLLFGTLGTPTNTAIVKYMNIKKVPHLFIAAAGARWNDPKNYPWSMGTVPSYLWEGRIYGKFLLQEKPDSKIAVIYQNDDYGRDLLKGLKEALGEKAGDMVISENSFEITDPTIDTQIVKSKASGADVFMDFTPPKFAAQAIRKLSEIGWKPYHILNSVGSSIGTAIKPAGFENAQGIVSSAYNKDASDPRWADDPGMKEFFGFIDARLNGVSKDDLQALNGYNFSQMMEQVLRQCGDDLSRENVMRQAANLKNFHPSGLLPGITVNTSPTDYAPMKSLQLVRFEGEKWVPFGPLRNGE
ncbi:ABC transporter substrate-binding protein [Bradyrhizobium sp. WYCCWR 13022]|uniref:ABC transporter substrate-binding protein n=1 Tax=unclassified Bradyrhizobium TaxID=2631580 RepID=UPI00263A8B73|nr:ABC transporter substrate-binding protein [Bradyrhizobium sp. WYCCWR 13022]MDN4984325.1 ABC transporter substrate-binding protein [Bradyrhizobium sp. WYCCWR 13022]